jgi:hypothetical protein
VADYSIDETINGSLMSDVTLNGLDNTKVTLAGENTVHTDSSVTLAPVTSAATVTLEPLTTSSTVTLEPLTTTSTVDLKPVAVDTCLRIELAPLPPTEVCVPYEQRWTVSLFGVEVLALGVHGKTSSEIRPAPQRPVEFGLSQARGCGAGCDCDGHAAGVPRQGPLVIEL